MEVHIHCIVFPEKDCPHATTDEAFAMAKRNLKYLQRITGVMVQKKQYLRGIIRAPEAGTNVILLKNTIQRGDKFFQHVVAFFRMC